MGTIKNVKVVMSRIGVHAASFNKVVYMPAVTITYTDPNRKKFNTFISVSDGNIGLKKKDYHGVVICGDFFVILFTNEWEIRSDDCKLLATMKPCGTPIQADETEFVVRNDNVITWYNKEGNNVGSRELTAEELEYLDKK